jgi:acyl-CoA thioesterase-1
MTNPRLLPLALLLLSPLCSPAQTNVVLEDTFTLDGGSRQADGDFPSLAVEKGDADWKRMGSLKFTADGKVTAGGTGGALAIVPLPALTETMTIEAEINPQGSGFVALAFMEQGSERFWGDTPLWVAFWPKGKCELRAGNDLVEAGEGGAAFLPGEPNHLQLIYDTVNNQASVKLNGEVILDQILLPQISPIAYACFRFQEPLKPGLPTLDNFRVTQGGGTTKPLTPPPAPAPAAPKPAGKPAPPAPKPTRPLSELMGKPLWNSDVITNEPLLFIDSGDGPVARLLFPPSEILSVESATLATRFEAARDFEIQRGSNLVKLKPGSTIPYLTLEELFPAPSTPGAIKAARGERAAKFGGLRWIRSTENVKAYFSKQVVVTYRHWESWTGYRPSGELPRSLAKLKEGGAFTFLVIGDSISAGCFASANLKSPPYQPTYPNLVKEGLQAAYGGDPRMVNLSKGGQVATYGLAQVPQIVAKKPDLVLIAFGMNDGSARVPAQKFGASVENTIKGIRESLPETEIILVSTVLGNPEWSESAPELYPQYRDALASLVQPGIALADMTALSRDVLEVKAYADTTVNGVNHPNDFMHRLYAQIILDLLGADHGN